VTVTTVGTTKVYSDYLLVQLCLEQLSAQYSLYQLSYYSLAPPLSKMVAVVHLYVYTVLLPPWEHQTCVLLA
jgi:hypothetical protein